MLEIAVFPPGTAKMPEISHRQAKRGLRTGANYTIINTSGLSRPAMRRRRQTACRCESRRGGIIMVKAIVGANWGDEGKGKITDLLAETSDVVVRFQGGANAGHTIINDYGRFALHILPSGTFYPHITNVIGNGVALDAAKLAAELKEITDRGVPAPNLIVSDRKSVV